MDVVLYARVVRKGWWIILLCTALATGAGLLATSRATPAYQADLKLFVAGQTNTDVNSALTSNYLSLARVKSYADLATSRPSINQVLRYTGDTDDRPKVTAAPLADTVILQITVQDSNPLRAERIANAFGVVMPQVIELYERPKTGGVSPIHATVSQPAIMGKKVSPKPLLNLGLGLSVGLIVGGALALLREQLDNSVKNPEDLERVSKHLPLMGAVFFDADSAKNPLVTSTDPRSPRAEAFRQLRTNVQFAEIDSELRSFVVTSALPNEGKSTVAANLAIALAQAGQKVILVEADLRRPSLGEYMGFERAIGLTSVLIGQVPLLDALQAFGADERLAVLPGGPVPPNPSEILGSQAMNELIRQLEELADIVIFDTPPLLPVTDAAVLAAQTRGALLVVRANKTTRDQVRRALRALEAVGATAMGVTLNFVRASELTGYKYGYGGYGGYASYTSRSDVPTMQGPAPELVPLRRRGPGTPMPPASPPRTMAGVAATPVGPPAPATSPAQPTPRDPWFPEI